MTEWKTIETAPKGSAILTWDGSRYEVAFWWSYQEWVTVTPMGDPLVEEPTHWMPLPKPPSSV